MDDLQGDICRVCRSEGQSDRQLFHPCICTGSIKWIHQECLMQWMRYSRKEFCELCGHRFSFTPIYSPDMPRVLPLRDVAGGLISSVSKAIKYWVHYTLVAYAWLVFVPFTAYRMYTFMFNGSYDVILSVPFDMFVIDKFATDALHGTFVVACTLLAFIGLIWMREQILHGGGPDWLEREDAPAAAAAAANPVDVPADVPVPVPADGPVAADAPAAAANHVPDEGGGGGGDNGAAAVARENNNNNINNNNNEARRVIGPDVPLIDPAEPPQRDIDDEPAQPEPVAGGGGDDAGAAAADQEPGGGGDEANWNPMEWDRADELTWERLLGLDGSHVFFEHVCWVISLNTIFIFFFAFCPYTIGNYAISALGLIRSDKPLVHFHGLLTTLVGYCIIGITLIGLHGIARFFRMKRTKRILGFCYIAVKVSLLGVVEIGVLPLVCGWWLDICSLPVFDATLKDRKLSFQAAPGTSLFIHWMFGMVYVYYLASFIVLLREVLRPGVLWFLRNLNDPDFNPIQVS